MYMPVVRSVRRALASALFWTPANLKTFASARVHSDEVVGQEIQYGVDFKKMLEFKLI